jgi:hypothetical protein
MMEVEGTKNAGGEKNYEKRNKYAAKEKEVNENYLHIFVLT